MFENEVLKRIPKKVKIGLIDFNEVADSFNEQFEWLKKYNVQFYESWNTSCVYHLAEAKSLKVLRLYNLPSCEERELNVFLQLKNLHSLIIDSKQDVE